MLEPIQRRATKYILNDYISSYKSRLQQLNNITLPLMFIFKPQDLMSLIKSLKLSTDNFKINNHNLPLQVAEQDLELTKS